MRSINNLTAALITVLILFIGACTSNKKEATNDHQESADSQAKPTFKEAKLEAAYQHYIHLKDALVASNSEEAKKGAEALQNALKEAQGAEKASMEVGKVVSSSDLKAQRIAFSELSNAMSDIIRNDDLSSGQVYVAYCPMANGNKGAYWLSNQKAIRNPYFGDEMLKCGEVKETLVAK